MAFLFSFIDFTFARMSQPRLEAHFENRVYYFTLTSKTPEKISISMYSTDYTFVKTEKGWENATSNKNQMAGGLIRAVVETLL